VAIGVAGVVVFRRRQNQCSIARSRKRKNLAILVASVAAIGVAVFLGLDRASTWAFVNLITPMQSREIIGEDLARARLSALGLDTELADFELVKMFCTQGSLPGPDGIFGTDDNVINPKSYPVVNDPECRHRRPGGFHVAEHRGGSA